MVIPLLDVVGELELQICLRRPGGHAHGAHQSHVRRVDVHDAGVLLSLDRGEGTPLLERVAHAALAGELRELVDRQDVAGHPERPVLVERVVRRRPRPAEGRAETGEQRHHTVDPRRAVPPECTSESTRPLCLHLVGVLCVYVREGSLV